MCSTAVFHDFGFPVFPTCGIVSGCMGQDAEACEHVARPLIIAALFFPLFGLMMNQIPFAAQMSNFFLGGVM